VTAHDDAAGSGRPGQTHETGRFLFPEWSNAAPALIAAGGAVVTAAAVFAVWFWWSPKHTDVGYQPRQPVPYSHRLHVSTLGLDCRYCHYNVERSPHAGVPPTSVCMNCHTRVLPDSPRLLPVRESWASDMPVPWTRIHKLPDYAYFDHSLHLNAGIGCVSCHGRIDLMEKVSQREPLSMGWCIECHRAPEQHLRPEDQLTNMLWTPPEDARTYGAKLRAERDLNPPEHCSACHR
jgi:hypothetical protein